MHQAQQATTLAEAVMRTIARETAIQRETFWALRDISFDVRQGEVLGIVGRNGAGKSTLLKIISRITEPTTGEIELFGRVGSLLEVGTGFHPELTGRENIFLNGSILGMTRREIMQRFEEIVDFSECEKFLDTPVKHYSSGMYVRLAFSIAAHLRPEILIVDEVLAVGDAAFQKKCLGKMHAVSEQEGRTVLLVSHNMNAIASLCTSALLIQEGKLAQIGNPFDVVQSYYQTTAISHTVSLIDHPARQAGRAPVLTAVELLNETGEPTTSFAAEQPVQLRISVETKEKWNTPVVSAAVCNAYGERIFAVASFLGTTELPSLEGSNKVLCKFVMPPLVPGTYSLDLSVNQVRYGPLIDEVLGATVFEVRETNFLGTSHTYFREMGHLLVKSEWSLSS